MLSTPQRKQELNNWIRLFIFITIWGFSSGCLHFFVTIFFPLNLSKKDFEIQIENNFAFAFSLQLAISLAVFFSVFIMARLIEKKSLVGWSFKFDEALLGFGIGLCLIILFQLVLLIFGFTELSFNRVSLSILRYFILYLLVALMEESFTRGYVLNNLLESTNKYVAVFLSAIFFGALHLLNNGISWIGYLNLVLFGVFAALLAIKTNSLSMSVGFHLSWNFFQGSILGFAVSGHSSESLFTNYLNGKGMITGGAFGAEGSLIVTIILIASNLLLIGQKT